MKNIQLIILNKTQSEPHGWHVMMIIIGIIRLYFFSKPSMT